MMMEPGMTEAKDASRAGKRFSGPRNPFRHVFRTSTPEVPMVSSRRPTNLLRRTRNPDAATETIERMTPGPRPVSFADAHPQGSLLA
jgi:hypothetical protein